MVNVTVSKFLILEMLISPSKKTSEKTGYINPYGIGLMSLSPQKKPNGICYPPPPAPKKRGNLRKKSCSNRLRELKTSLPIQSLSSSPDFRGSGGPKPPKPMVMNSSKVTDPSITGSFLVLVAPFQTINDLETLFEKKRGLEIHSCEISDNQQWCFVMFPKKGFRKE